MAHNQYTDIYSQTYIFTLMQKGNCKGDKTSSWWRLRTYKNQVDEQQHAELEGVRLQADRMAQDVEGLYPGLLEGFFTESGKEGGKDEY